MLLSNDFQSSVKCQKERNLHVEMSSKVYLVCDSKLGPSSCSVSKSLPIVQVLYRTTVFFIITKHMKYICHIKDDKVWVKKLGSLPHESPPFGWKMARKRRIAQWLVTRKVANQWVKWVWSWRSPRKESRTTEDAQKYGRSWPENHQKGRGTISPRMSTGHMACRTWLRVPASPFVDLGFTLGQSMSLKSGRRPLDRGSLWMRKKKKKEKS